jgi:hypothetical protein
MKLRPPDFELPYPAFTCQLFNLQPDMTLGQIALQYPGDAKPAEVSGLQRTIEQCLTGDSAPWRWERCSHVDTAGYRNDIVVGYWHRQADFAAWRRRADVLAWADELQPVGIWIEALTCPIPQMETSYSNAEPDWGLADQCPVHLDEYHGYFGSMRDRIPAAEDQGLPGALRSLPAADMAQETFGRRLAVDLPDNACFIRTVQGWEDCDDAQQADFLASMMPVYHAGVEYLRDNPRAANCVGARLVEMLDPDAQIQTQTLAWFLGLEDLERWAHEHPTHHAILSGMGEFAERYNLDLQIVLGHEVYVVPAGCSHIEYSNCHPETGFLRFFPGQLL